MHCIEYKNIDLNTLEIPPKHIRTLTLSVLGQRAAKLLKKNVCNAFCKNFYTPLFTMYTQIHTFTQHVSS